MIGRWRAGSPWFDETGDPTDRGGVNVRGDRDTSCPASVFATSSSTAGGERVAVITHRTGRRELAIYDRADPDACTTVLHLSSDDTRTLAELLGASPVSEAVAAVQQRLEGLAIDWVTVPAGIPLRRRHHRRRRVPDPHRGVDRGRDPRRDHDAGARPRPRLRGRRRHRRRRDDRGAGPAARPAGVLTVLAAAGPEAAKAFIEIGARGPGPRRPRPPRRPARASPRSPSTCWPGWRSARAASPRSTSAPTSSASWPRSASCSCC